MSKLDDILNHVIRTYENWETGNNDGYEVDKAVDDIKDLMLELIGGNRNNINGAATITYMNRYKDELRRKVNEL